MKREKPLILLSNDDGVEAKGLNRVDTWVAWSG